ncbi:MAG TPA: DUF5668 domain-containing protein [Bacteroidales bacterium]|nr:hypothetical protein [Bacteroidales bacterium]HNQ82502.1 DUF5668 domain-containing protein [Bacteroidales bacterium]HOX76691.1 DUF5668 domain-containing protein [Bacteroidales bacterium]HPI86427.1 DUF5668 domain-containing protein [Bacteroidales bacterium]
MKAKNIIWGLVLVLIGVMFILKNLDVIYFSWHSIWRLWPIVLVLIGVTILPIKDLYKIILTVIVMIIGALFLIYVPGNRDNDWSFRFDRDITPPSPPDKLKDIDQRIFEAYDTIITSAKLDFDAAAGNFRIEDTTAELFEFEREGNLGKYVYSIKDLGSRREINIELDEGRIRGDFRNKVAVKLNPLPVWDLKVDVGAANIDMDLSSFKVENIDIDGGASSINVKMGSLYDHVNVKINSGASSINIKVPEEFGCKIVANTVLSSKDLNGFNHTGGGNYETPDYQDKSKFITIKIEAAVSSLFIQRY